MVELDTERELEAAAWRVKNLAGYNELLESAAMRVAERSNLSEAALIIYETALMKSGRTHDEVRDLVRRFQETFEDEEEALIIPRVSSIMNVEGDEWFLGDPGIRTLAGRLLGQFQHRVAQYNYVDEREVLRRWADAYDTRLFIRRRIFETEPVAGVVTGFTFPLMQHLRVAAGGDTTVPGENIARALAALDLGEPQDDYEILALAEGLALRLGLPAPVVGEMLEELACKDRLEFPEPPPALFTEPEYEETDEEAPEPSPGERAARRAARREAARGDEPTRVQDPQAKDAPAIAEEKGQKRPAPPEEGRRSAPGSSEEDS